jgi:NAD(P)-dependent dehydrogenase (short-subunit alcohol dehydrogenase family)
MKTLQGKIAVVAGASRGAGRGIALALGDAGATVYTAARTSRHGPPPTDKAPGTVEDTAEQVSARGGKGIPVHADLSDQEQVSALFRPIEKDDGRLDVLANSAWGVNFMPEWSKRFWELSPSLWSETLATVRVCWLTSVHAARLMVNKGGLIAHVTENLYPDPSTYRGQILHDTGHECLNRLIAAMSRDGKKTKITIVGSILVSCVPSAC